MKKIFLSFLVFLFVCLPVISESIDTVFLNVPQNVMPYLSKNAKLDLIDYAKCGMHDVFVETQFGGKSQIVEYNDSSLTIKINEDFLWSLKMKINEENDTTYHIIKSIKSYSDTICSQNTYSKEWLPL